MLPIVPNSASNVRDAIRTAMTPAGTWINGLFNENPTRY
jgi:hypothetical protein